MKRRMVMGKGNCFKRVMAVSLVFIMAAAFMPVLGMSDASAAAKKGRLVKSVTKKYYDSTSKTWRPSTKTSYAYNKKADPSKITMKQYSGDGKLVFTETQKNTYTYKKGVHRARKSTTTYSGGGGKATAKFTYNKYGNPTKQTYKYTTEGYWSKSTTNYKSTKYGYLKSKSSKFTYSDGGTGNYKMKNTVKQSKKLLKKLAMYSYIPSTKKYQKDGSFSYNSKGLLTKIKRADSGYTVTYKYAWKSGRVSSVVVTTKSPEGDTSKAKYTISYTNKKIGKVRYAKMIDSIVSSGEYELYPWY